MLARMEYALVEVIGREISDLEFFPEIEDAHREMKRRFFEASGLDETEYTDEVLDNAACDNGSFGVTTFEAYCDNANHDHCDWRICPIPLTYTMLGPEEEVSYNG